MSPTAIRMTVREFLELPDDGNRYELIEGELVLNASPVLRHQRMKKKLYERFGVDEYWIVDHELEVVKIYRATAGAYGKATEISAEDDGAAITSPLLPGFSLSLVKLFA